MKQLNNIIENTLFYNLIIFDFILLESSSKKISNFFVEKIKNKKNLIYRISLFSVFKTFKRYIRLLQFLQKKEKYIKIFFYFLYEKEEIFEVLSLLFNQYKLSCFLEFNLFSPLFKHKFLRRTIKTTLIFDQYLNLNDFYSFFFKKFYLLYSFNSFLDSSISTFKIVTDLSDYKKLLFIGLIFISFFKK
jgi:hypothetical protein